ncbi:MAG: helix-turn-helix domain-containing protein [Zymomonas mobilis]|uniref:helix-turn-helix domain-containing protein n=1 Tax=Zymomonas mobilis TaxID=542 RepID=UPI0039E84DF2
MEPNKVIPDWEKQLLASVDWEKVDATTDEDIDQQIASDPDTAPLPTEKQIIGGQIQRLRRGQLKMSQREFSRVFGIPFSTLADWEQGRKKPNSVSLNYLALIKDNPDSVRRTIERVMNNAA